MARKSEQRAIFVEDDQVNIGPAFARPHTSHAHSLKLQTSGIIRVKHILSIATGSCQVK